MAEDILEHSYCFAEDSEIILRTRGETVLAYNLDNSDMYEMNDTAGEIFSLMMEKKKHIKVGDIIALLKEEYDVDEETLLEDVSALVERLLENGVIQVEETANG